MHTHDAYTVLLVLKLGLVVVVIVIITVVHQVFISPYKPTSTNFELNIQNILFHTKKNKLKTKYRERIFIDQLLYEVI